VRDRLGNGDVTVIDYLRLHTAHALHRRRFHISRSSLETAPETFNGAIAGTRGPGAGGLLLVMMPEYEHMPHGQTDDNE
jgi:hypothetical protein